MGGKARGKKGKTSKAEKEQKRAARLSLIDKEGRMPRQDGIRFYSLLDFVALIVIEDVEKARQPINGPPIPPLGWPRKDGMQCMSVGARNIVIHHILNNIDDIVREVDSGKHDTFFKTSVGRSIEEADKKDIRSWKNHVQDEFIVVDFIPHRGGESCLGIFDRTSSSPICLPLAVFVQVGRVPEKEVEDHFPRLLNESDVHEPRVFLVQGLASPLAEMCGKQSKELLATYPSLSSYDLPIAFIHTTLLNYLGGITYAVTVEAENQSHHYRTPQLILESARIAVEAYKSTVLKNEPVSTSAKLYKSIEPAFARLANDEMRGLVRESMLAQDRGDIDDRRDDPKVLTVSVLVMMWLPFQHGPTDPATLQALEEITSGDRPLRVLREGFKYQACKSMDIRDDEPCPLCRRMMGDVARPFVECCKPGHLKRAKKGIKHQDRYSEAYLYNPVDQDEGNYLIRNPHLRFEILNRLRIGPLSCSDVKLIVPRKYIEEIKWRLDNAPIFLAVLEYKWLYLGWVRSSELRVSANTSLTPDPIRPRLQCMVVVLFHTETFP